MIRALRAFRTIINKYGDNGAAWGNLLNLRNNGR